MPARYLHRGNQVDYTNPSSPGGAPGGGGDLPAGAVVVQGELVGVTARPIPAGTTGSLAVTGVFEFPKASGAGSAIACGTRIYWDAANQVISDSSSAGKLIGKTVRDAADNDTTVWVRME